MKYLSDHPLLLSLPFHESVETLSAVRSLSSFFLRRVDAQVKELAIILGIQRPVRHYKDLLYEYARLHFTSFVIPELGELWVKHAVKENKVEALRQATLEYDAHFFIKHVTSPEMFTFLTSNLRYRDNFFVPLYSLEVTLLRLNAKPAMRKSALRAYIKKDNVEEIETLANTFGLNLLDVPNLYAIIGPNLFQALNRVVPPPPDVRPLSSRRDSFHRERHDTRP